VKTNMQLFNSGIEKVQNCPDQWDVSSAAYKDTRSKGQISSYIRFRPNLSIIPALSVSSPAINIKQDQVGLVANLACFVI